MHTTPKRDIKRILQSYLKKKEERIDGNTNIRC